MTAIILNNAPQTLNMHPTPRTRPSYRVHFLSSPICVSLRRFWSFVTSRVYMTHKQVQFSPSSCYTYRLLRSTQVRRFLHTHSEKPSQSCHKATLMKWSTLSWSVENETNIFKAVIASVITTQKVTIMVVKRLYKACRQYRWRSQYSQHQWNYFAGNSDAIYTKVGREVSDAATSNTPTLMDHSCSPINSYNSTQDVYLYSPLFHLFLFLLCYISRILRCKPTN